MDLSQVVSYILAHAQWIGPALLAAGLAVRLAGRVLGHLLLAVGVLATGSLAYLEWQSLHSLPMAGGILLAGLVLFGLLAWTVRGISFLFAFVLLAAAFYLILYGWMGPGFAGSTAGSLAWAGATVATMVLTSLRSLVLRHAAGAAVGTGL